LLLTFAKIRDFYTICEGLEGSAVKAFTNGVEVAVKAFINGVEFLSFCEGFN
jgi:hypothetical protein